jgi:hypothetical protein
MRGPLDRALGRAAPPASTGFDVRPFGTTKAEAAAIAAAAPAAPSRGTVSGTTGSSGSGSNLTTSTYARPSQEGVNQP